jgi:hypothetical protein
MEAFHKIIDDMLDKLGHASRTELDLVRDLSEAVRAVDERLLSEQRSLTAQHSNSREAILIELTTLSAHLCHFRLQPTDVVDQASG